MGRVPTGALSFARRSQGPSFARWGCALHREQSPRHDEGPADVDRAQPRGRRAGRRSSRPSCLHGRVGQCGS
eukprot:11156203-Lingulodinium_polyedra.AAC.1